MRERIARRIATRTWSGLQVDPNACSRLGIGGGVNAAATVESIRASAAFQRVGKGVSGQDVSMVGADDNFYI